jgi:hypothetical protein
MLRQGCEPQPAPEVCLHESAPSAEGNEPQPQLQKLKEDIMTSLFKYNASQRKSGITALLFVFMFLAVSLNAFAATSLALSSITPATGPLSGGNTITLNGSGFTTNTSVWIWANQAPVAKYVSATQLTVTVPAKSSAGAVDVVAIDSGVESRLSGGYTYSAAAAVPQLSLSAGSMTFASTALGSSSTQALTLTNSGTASLAVSAATLTGAGFTGSGTVPLSLTPGQQATLQVKFAPTTAGTVSGKISLTSNSASSATSTVTLTGTGAAAGTALSECSDITTSGSYYLAQNVSSQGTCFFIDADNVTLNLNGHTITYGTGGGTQGTPGILLADSWYTAPGYSLSQTGSTNNHGGFVMYGGTLTEAANAAPQSRGIWVGQSNDVSPAPAIYNMKINTSTQDSEPIFGTSSVSGWKIYNNTLNWNCISHYPATAIPCDSDRYELMGYALWIADQPNAPGAVPDQIYNNTILAAPQGGIYVDQQNAQIHNNDITFNSFFTNDYCIATVSGDGQVINDNYCHPTSGRGIDAEATNVQVTNNTIVTTELPQNAEYGGCERGGTDGIRLRDNAYQGNPSAPIGVVVSGNTITVSAIKCQANGIQITNLQPGDTVTIAKNVITSTAVSPQQDFGIDFDEAVQPPLTFTGNTIKSSHAFVGVEWDGASVVITSSQTWVGTPQFFVDNENGFNDPADGGPTFTQSLVVDDLVSGGVECGTYATGVVKVGNTDTQCNP